jgi:hypothetical protein
MYRILSVREMIVMLFFSTPREIQFILDLKHRGCRVLLGPNTVYYLQKATSYAILNPSISC